MVLSRLSTLVRRCALDSCPNSITLGAVRTATSSKSGGVLPEPYKTSFGILRVMLTVIPGLLIGAAISKNIASFLEENDLFVPSDDDDDDD